MSVLFAVIKSNRSITVKAYGAYAADKPPESIEITRRAPGEHDIQIDIAYCGERHFTAAPALKWSAALFEAARAHSQDMARQRYFSHTGKDGREVEERAVRAGYRWRGIGENIAAGQASPEEAMTGWLASPGHCANIMDRSFTEMGAAYGTNVVGEQPRVYSTQVFGQPR